MAFSVARTLRGLSSGRRGRRPPAAEAKVGCARLGTGPAMVGAPLPSSRAGPTSFALPCIRILWADGVVRCVKYRISGLLSVALQEHQRAPGPLQKVFRANGTVFPLAASESLEGNRTALYERV